MDKNKFGNYIKEKRTEKGLTQKQLADSLMIDVTAVSKWERGITYPDITMIPDICKHLSINEHELIESSNDTEYRIIKAQAKKYRNIKDGIFYSFSISYFLAVLICFIVNLAVDHTLSWFFIVAASCLCGFTFLPTCTRFFKKYKLSIFIATTFLSMALLFVTCSIYTKNYWMFIAISGVLLGYVAIFYPVLFAKQKSYMSEQKYKSISKYFFITYALALFAITALLILSISAYTPVNLPLAFKITGYCFILPVIYGIVELIPINRLIKLGTDSLITGIFFYGLNGVLNFLLGDNGIDYYHVDFSNWQEFTNGNVAIISLTLFTVIGITMILIGILRKKKKD